MTKRNLTLIAVIFIVAGAIAYLESIKVYYGPGFKEIITQSSSTQTRDVAWKNEKFKRALEMTTPDGFINSEPFTLAELVGKKVILLDIWTYSCINCQRTLPYLNAWHEKYADKGLVIVGLHTPEFRFEHEYDNVAAAVEKFRIKYPVVLDNDYSTWRAYNNNYWPRKYLIDIDGFIVYDHIGEGGYEETENKIQEALRERSIALGDGQSVSGGYVNPEGVIKVDPFTARSPETYFGSLRNKLGTGKSQMNGSQTLEFPKTLKKNVAYFDGIWEFQDEFAENISAVAGLRYVFSGKKVYMVASSLNGAEVEVFLDGKKISAEMSGIDVFDGGMSIQDERLYEIVSAEQTGEHLLELIFKDPGLRAFTFTFG